MLWRGVAGPPTYRRLDKLKCFMRAVINRSTINCLNLTSQCHNGGLRALERTNASVGLQMRVLGRLIRPSLPIKPTDAHRLTV